MKLFTEKLTREDAEFLMRRYLAEQGYHLVNFREWARWDWLPRPMWSVWAIIYADKKGGYRFIGLHIFDDGEVLIAYRDPGMKDF